LLVKPATLRRWLQEGVSTSGRIKLEAFFEVEREKKEHRKGDRRAFELLMRMAEEEGKIKRHRTHQGVRAGPKTSGYKWVRGWGARLTPDSMFEILEWFRSHEGERRWPKWHAVVIAAAFGPGELPGSPPPKLYQFDHPRAGEFVYETIFQSSVRSTLGAALGELESEFEKSLDEGLIVWVHTLSLANFRWRTRRQRLDWENLQRRRRSHGRKR